MRLMFLAPRLLFVLVVLLVSPAAFAQLVDEGVLNKTEISDGCAGTMNADVCFHSGDWWNVSFYGNDGIIECGLSGGCSSCGTNGYGKQICVKGIAFSASCTCTNDHVDGAGPGITTCHPRGSCTFRQNP